MKLVEAEAAMKLASAGPEAPEARANPSAGKLGLSVEPLPVELADRLKTGGRGVRVTEVTEDGPAASKIAAGSDVVLEVLYPAPRRAVRNVGDLQTAVAALKDGDYISLLVQSVDPRLGQRVVNIRVGN